MDATLVPGRECGACNVCCVALTIDDPALQKPQGYRCRNAQRDNSCAIYESRPGTCSNFYCGWRRLRWVKETLRPDVSDVLVQVHVKAPTGPGPGKTGIAVTLLSRAALKAEGLAETIAAAVKADLPVTLQIPGPPGHTYGQAGINDALIGPVAARDKAGVLEVLRQAQAAGRRGNHKLIVLKPRPPALDPGFGDGGPAAPTP